MGKSTMIFDISSDTDELLSEFEKMLKSDNMADKPPEIPEKRVPKDGDPLDWHKDHKIIPGQANYKAYLYCKDCKVEVVNKKSKTMDFWI